MTEPLEFGIGDLISELFAHTLIFFCAEDPARAVSARSFKTFFDAFDRFGVGIINNFHTLIVPQKEYFYLTFL